jgi:hypothetical protein
MGANQEEGIFALGSNNQPLASLKMKTKDEH